MPLVLAPAPDGSAPAYRTIYLALAQERFADAGLDGELAASDRYLELYGIEPSLEVVRRRLTDESRQWCHDAVDDTALASAPARITEESKADALARIATAKQLRAELEHDCARKQLADLDALAASDPQYRRAVSAACTSSVATTARHLISPATEAAARALGWGDASTAAASLEALAASGTRFVAIALPRPPAYHAPAMPLEIEIDRGDVWHDPEPRWRDAARRPALIVHARWRAPGSSRALADHDRRMAEREGRRRYRPEMEGVAGRPAHLAGSLRWT